MAKDGTHLPVRNDDDLRRFVFHVQPLFDRTRHVAMGDQIQIGVKRSARLRFDERFVFLKRPRTGRSLRGVLEEQNRPTLFGEGFFQILERNQFFHRSSIIGSEQFAVTIRADRRKRTQNTGEAL